MCDEISRSSEGNADSWSIAMPSVSPSKPELLGDVSIYSLGRSEFALGNVHEHVGDLPASRGPPYREARIPREVLCTWATARSERT